jgi:carbamoyltransferase
MRVLGLSDHFISGAAVIEDGRIVSAIAEERLARQKLVMGFPWKAISAVMEVADVEPKDIDAVAVASEWGHFLGEYVDFKDGVFGVDEGVVRNLFFSVGSHLSGLRSKIPVLENLYYDLRKPAFAKRCDKIRKVMKEEYGLDCPVEFVPHHHCHAAGAYAASGFRDGLMVTLDGAGDGHSSHVYDVRDGKWEHLHSVPSYDSLGDYYGYVTQLSGFKSGKHEGKITGLAAHGEPIYRDVLDRFIKYKDGTIENVGQTFRHAALKKLDSSLPDGWDRKHLAATIQDVAEDITTHYVRYWRDKTGHSNVGLAGGVFANVKINQRVLEIDGVEAVFVYPAMSDEGIAAGAALIIGEEMGNGQRPDRCFEHAYLGPDFSDEEIERALKESGLEFERLEDVPATLARLIADKYVVARFDGRMEYGPRALGNRSILYRPDEPEVNDWLNKRLRRTEFMPFAPAVLAEDAHLYFERLEGATDTARFMTITFDCTDLMKQTCPGVVHVDGTARPQLVSESDNAVYYHIIREFKELTGLSCIVNTSFNIHEEPIVCTPQDAIRAFQTGHLDVLSIGPFLVRNTESEHDLRETGATDSEGGERS